MPDKECRPATREDVKALLKTLNESGVDYLLIGGFALMAHGYTRFTTDVDLLVPGNIATGTKLIQVLMTLPDKVAKEIDPQWFTEGGTIRVGDVYMIDLLMNANGHTYEKLLPHLETVYLDEVPVRTLDLAGLLLTKQTPRDKDISDRVILERALGAISQQQPT